MNTYGVLSVNHGVIDVSKTERGAKIYATIHGYDKVYIRFNCGYVVELVSEKVNGKWKAINENI